MLVRPYKANFPLETYNGFASAKSPLNFSLLPLKGIIIMKKGQIILGATALLVTVRSSFVFKVSNKFGAHPVYVPAANSISNGGHCATCNFLQTAPAGMQDHASPMATEDYRVGILMAVEQLYSNP